jgi:hypothetical protein
VAAAAVASVGDASAPEQAAIAGLGSASPAMAPQDSRRRRA